MKKVKKIWQKTWKSNKQRLQENGMNKAYLNRLLVQEIEAHKRKSGRHTVLELVRIQNRRWCYRQ
jgi:hypothetical protein